MTYFDSSGDPVEVCQPEVYDEPTSQDLDATAVYCRLLSMCSTPGQVAAAQFVCGMDTRTPGEIALALRISRPRFFQLRKQAKKRMTLLIARAA